MAPSPKPLGVLSLIGFTTLVLHARLAHAQDDDKLPVLIEHIDVARLDLTDKQQAIIAKLKKQPTTVEVEPVKFNSDALQAERLWLKTGHRSLVATKSNVRELPGGGVLWSGVLVEEGKKPSSTIELFVQNNKATGQFFAGDYAYELRPLGSHLILVTRDPEKTPPDHPADAEQQQQQGRPRKKRAPTERATDDNAAHPALTSVTLLVAYTPNVGAKYMDPVEAELSIRGIVETSINAIFSSTALPIPVRIDLVHVHPVTYTETGNLVRDLARFKARKDRHMDDVHVARSKSNADLLVLLADADSYSPRITGWADAVGADYDSAFAIVTDEAAGTNFSMAHELGHLFGARHDVGADARTVPFQYGHGFRYCRDGWRTIMVPKRPGERGCFRYGLWSSPACSIDGAATGSAHMEDNARLLGEQAPTLAAFN